MGSAHRFACKVSTLLGILALAQAFIGTPPAAHAMVMPLGNYNLQLAGRRDFHTWIWSITSCPGDCVHVNALGQPVAGAFNYVGDAQLVGGRYTLTVDTPNGLRCGDIYVGPTIPTHDVYNWDAVTLAGTLESSSDAGCDGAPGGTRSYPFTLSRM
jgi:hypothetical protein